MFKSTKNCFKSLETIDTVTNESHNKFCNGLSYYNHFLLPQVGININNETGKITPIPIHIETMNRDSDGHRDRVIVSSSVYSHLCNIKHQIAKYQESWDNTKKFTNPYEYIHTNIVGNKTNISKLRPLSRSFYKMIEIIKNYNILSQYSDTICDRPDVRMGMRTFHLAEGPGGFIEAIAYLRGMEYQNTIGTTITTTSNVSSISGTTQVQILKRNTELHNEVMKDLEQLKLSRRIFENQKEMTFTMPSVSPIYGNDRYYGMTLVNDDPICPGWKKTRTFLEQHPNVIIETGADKTGNLISTENFKECAFKYQNKMDLITADGGFDFSVDFNNQENMAAQLILCEVFYALALQKQGGTFILKIFDVFHKPTIDILYILCYYYSNISIIKPHTSRIANSEKYVVCQGFKMFDSSEIIEQIISLMPQLTLACKTREGSYNNQGNECDTDEHNEIVSILPEEHDLFFLNKIEEMNAMVSFQQIENITSTLSIITNYRNAEKLDQFKKTNINKCIAWCEYYDIPYNIHQQSIQSTNIFLHRTAMNTQNGQTVSGNSQLAAATTT